MEECLKLSLIILIFSSFQFDRAKPMEDDQTKEPITTTTTPQGILIYNVTFYLLNILNNHFFDWVQIVIMTFQFNKSNTSVKRENLVIPGLYWVRKMLQMRKTNVQIIQIVQCFGKVVKGNLFCIAVPRNIKSKIVNAAPCTQKVW